MGSDAMPTPMPSFLVLRETASHTGHTKGTTAFWRALQSLSNDLHLTSPTIVDSLAGSSYTFWNRENSHRTGLGGGYKVNLNDA